MSTQPHCIAIVGLACIYPDARTPVELWENVLAQRRAFRQLPPERLRIRDYWSSDRTAQDCTYATEAAVIEGYEFDRVKFRVVGSTFRSADLAHWLALDVASQALADAGFPDGDGLPHETTGVLLGNTLTGEFSRANVLRLRWPFVRRVIDAALARTGWLPDKRSEFLEGLQADYKSPFPPVDEESLVGGLSNTIAGRICSHFDLQGGGYTVDGACASSLLAVAHACDTLTSGDLDIALAGGVDISIDPFELVGFAKTGALATEEMRVFDQRSAGFWPGEGCGFAVLQRYEDALAQGRRVYGIIRGWGVSSDGAGGTTRPQVEGQLTAIDRAYRRAGFGFDTVGYCEGHGTGTALGDATELEALCRARRKSRANVPPLVIGSIKSNIGHTKAAAGIAGLIKATMALHRQVLPPMTGCDKPHPQIGGAVPALRLLNEPEPWPKELPLRASVSAMGFGGINAHIVIEGPVQDRRSKLEITEYSYSASKQDSEVFLLSASTPAELSQQVDALLELAGRISHAELGDMAVQLQKTLPCGPVRSALVASRPKELVECLSILKSWLNTDFDGDLKMLDGVYLSTCGMEPRIGYLFPGQGCSVKPGGGIFRRRFPVVRELYGENESAVNETSYSTDVAQSAIVRASIAGLRLLRMFGITATVGIGHSLGELSALHWAGAFDEETLARLVKGRGRAMADLVPSTGAMAALAASESEVTQLLIGSSVSIVGLNSRSQNVVAGEASSVAEVMARARSRGIAAVRLQGDHAFHTPDVAVVAPSLAQFIASEKIQNLSRLIISTVTGDVLPANANLCELLCRQLTSPVKFLEAVTIGSGRADLWIEVGSGEVVSGLARESLASPVFAMDVCSESLRGLWKAVGASFVMGASVNIASLFEGRFTRSLSFDRKLKFFASPCESALVADTEHERNGGAPAVHALTTSSKSELVDGSSIPADLPLRVFRELVAERGELPLAAVKSESRLLIDLHLNSLSVGKLVSEAARRLGLPALIGITDFATATVGGVAAALLDLKRRGVTLADEKGRVPVGVDSWVRAFVLEWIPAVRPDFQSIESGPPRKVAPGGVRAPSRSVGSWQVFGDSHHPLMSGLQEAITCWEGNGIITCLPMNADESHIGLLLDSSKIALAQRVERFVLVQHGRGAGSFVRTLHLEAPDIHTCTVDVPFHDRRAVEWIRHEALSVEGHRDARYDTAGVGHELVMKHLVLNQGELATPLTSEDVLLATGGGKGIASECVLSLARKSGVRLVLVGRSRPETDSELTANLERIRAAGIHCRYFSADVTDAAAVRDVLSQARSEVGTVTAFLHAAGTNMPQLINTLETADFRRTVATKVQGVRNVLAALDEQKLKLFVAFGSIIGRSGLRGEADYAVANEWLTDLTKELQEKLPRCQCVAVEWSVWSGLGMGARLGRIESLRQQGVEAITPEAGVEILEKILGQPIPGAAVVVTGRFGSLPTLKWANQPEAPFRFVENRRVYYPGVELVADATLSTESDPYVLEHVFEDEPLFPAVMGLEAMAQVASVLTRSEEAPTFEDVQFIRPVIVPRGGARTIRLAALIRAPGVVEVALRSDETGFQTDHFRATCRFSKVLPGGDAKNNDTKSFFGSGDIPPLPLQIPKDIYESLLFHGERFRRIRNYRMLHAKECLTELEPLAGANWFGPHLPQRCIMGCAALRDAAIHSIQACIPHARLLPVGLGRLVHGKTPCHGVNPDQKGTVDTLFLHAHEIGREGDIFHYDLELRTLDGVMVERWHDLRLRKIEEILPPQPWPAPLLEPWIERRFEELVPSSGIAVAFQRNSTRNGANGIDGRNAKNMDYRADGKPMRDGGRSISFSRSGELSLAVAGTHEVGCDLEVVLPRSPENWRTLLGSERYQLAELIAKNEPFDVAATRVWSVIECLKKSGCTASPLLESANMDRSVLFRAGRHSIATFVESIRDRNEPLVIGICAASDIQDPSAKLSPKNGHSGSSSKFYDYRLTVSFEDTNVVGNVYFSNYIRWQGKAREQFLSEEAPKILAEMSRGLELITISVKCDYHSQLFALDQVLIRMRLEALEPASVRMVFEYYREDRSGTEIVATGYQEVAACQLQNGSRKRVPLPESLREACLRYL